MTQVPYDHQDLRSDTRPIVVVPCFNEERRIDGQAFLAMVVQGDIRLLFVNDGSTDGTGRMLDRLRERCPSIEVHHFDHNVGKAEAVRQGMSYALGEGASIVGYLDADLATPGAELLRMIETMESRPELAAVFGSRVARLGSDIRRSSFRHYTGRVFATAASLALGVAVYDTQCGAKIFRANENLIDAVSQPFRSAWSFDVVLCQRLFDGTVQLPGLPTSAFLELPLESWTDVAGSKVSLAGAIMALVDLLALAVTRRWRARKTHKGNGPSANGSSEA
jgi:glycosyltransferase involved in cell wall biosynthesis